MRETLTDTKADPDREEIIAETTAVVLYEMQFGEHGYTEQAYEYIKHYCADKSPEAIIKAVMGVLKDVEEVINKILDAANEAASSSAVEQTALF